ncbi:SDR family oxidoreductase [Enterocloster citroniae]|uniref:SDR family NAD(P)-dependent oxidoreductase n=1 Tax=Enterocloster citroniae TaxID=358743 RepID=UPI001D072640|nr:SDR family NAD(P)-dependent oxidoreductase [Enterocloster citroniae]MCB7068266.1 SDR family oxidoreductase [Enterocloster citroniae]
MKLTGKIALITGGSSGIGAEIARLFAAEGAQTIISHHVSSVQADTLMGEIRENGGSIQCFQADLCREEEVSGLFEKIRRDYGHLDILINNAGRTFNIPFTEMTEESLHRDLDTNLLSAMMCSKYAASLMREQGWIVNTASIRGLYDAGRHGIMGYCAAKAGVISFTKNLALELAPSICVNAVAPGFVHTQYLDKDVPEKLKESWISQTPLKKLVDIKELAETYLLLATTRTMTGTVITVDGGYSILNR